MTSGMPIASAAWRTACTFSTCTAASPAASSRFMPMPPARRTAFAVSATFSAVSPKPVSMSALTGSDTAEAIRATACNMTETGMSSSANPSDAATPALVVATARNPAFSKMQALAASQALGSTRIPGPWCRSRKRMARARCVSRSIERLVFAVKDSAQRAERVVLVATRLARRQLAAQLVDGHALHDHAARPGHGCEEQTLTAEQRCFDAANKLDIVVD